MPSYFVIEKSKKLSLGASELWQFRELLFFFSWRDIKVKYKDTTIGIAWVLIQPIALTVLFTMIFSNRFQTYSGKLPYPVFVLSGLVLWQFISNSLTLAANSMDMNAKIIKKIYFPRLIIPLSSLVTSTIDLLIGLLLLLVACLFFEVQIDWTNLLLAFPVSFFILAATSLGFACLLSILNVIFKDFKYIIPFFMQLLFFTSPIFYDVRSLGNGWWAEFFAWNPFSTGIIVLRKAFSPALFDWLSIAKSAVMALAALAGGLFVFKKLEGILADLI